MRLTRYINESKEQLKDWKSYIKRNPMLKNAVDILNKISKKGYKCYLVGGLVRDVILGSDPHDVDICVNCPINILSEMFTLYDIGKSRDFGIVVVKVGGYSYEIAQMRGESYVIPKYVRKIIK